MKWHVRNQKEVSCNALSGVFISQRTLKAEVSQGSGEWSAGNGGIGYENTKVFPYLLSVQGLCDGQPAEVVRAVKGDDRTIVRCIPRLVESYFNSYNLGPQTRLPLIR